MSNSTGHIVATRAPKNLKDAYDDIFFAHLGEDEEDWFLADILEAEASICDTLEEARQDADDILSKIDSIEGAEGIVCVYIVDSDYFTVFERRCK